MKQHRWVSKVIYNICRSKFKKHRWDKVFSAWPVYNIILCCFVLIAFVLLLILSLWWMRWKRLWSQILRKWSLPCWWHPLNMMLLKLNKPWRYNFWLFLLQYVAKNLLNNTRMLLIIRVLGQMRPSWMKFWGPDQTRRLQHWRLLSKKVSRKMYIHTVHVHSKTRGSC